MMDVSSYLGIEYDQADCFGLVREVFRREKGVDIGHYMDPDFHRKWEEVPPAQARAMDILYIKIPGRNDHVGVCINEVTFLHALEGRRPVASRISAWNGRIEGVYRWRG